MFFLGGWGESAEQYECRRRVTIYSPLWKRVIAWERSRAASGYGIIWGDADRNKQEEFSAECHSVDCFDLNYR